jgi:glyoxylase-like metal-dependent hydrolase (beta-lactamase superfamily II)
MICCGVKNIYKVGMSIVFVVIVLLIHSIWREQKEYKFISLLDGYKDFPLQNFVQKDSDCDHPYFYADKSAVIANPVNVFLLDTCSDVILFDAGFAGLNNSATGKLIDSLEQAGYTADQVTAVCITHMHTDHIAGLVKKDGAKAFINAKVFVDRHEVDYWLSADNALKDSVRAGLIQKIIEMYDVVYVVAGQKIGDAVTVYPIPGHTAGHTGYCIDMQSKIVFVCGDIIHCDTLQFEYPEIAVLYDVNPAAAVAARRIVLQQAVDQGWVLAGVHITPPGFGRVALVYDESRNMPSYRWMPINSIYS